MSTESVGIHGAFARKAPPRARRSAHKRRSTRDESPALREVALQSAGAALDCGEVHVPPLQVVQSLALLQTILAIPPARALSATSRLRDMKDLSPGKSLEGGEVEGAASEQIAIPSIGPCRRGR